MRQERDDQGIPHIPMELHPILMRSSSLASLSLSVLSVSVYHPSIPSCTFYNLILSTSLCCSTSLSPEALCALFIITVFISHSRARLSVKLLYCITKYGACEVVNPCEGMQPVQRRGKLYVSSFASGAFAFLSELILLFRELFPLSLFPQQFNCKYARRAGQGRNI